MRLKHDLILIHDVSNTVENIVRKVEKFWLPTLPPFPTMLFKGFLVLTHSHTMTPFDAPGRQVF